MLKGTKDRGPTAARRSAPKHSRSAKANGAAAAAGARAKVLQDALTHGPGRYCAVAFYDLPDSSPGARRALWEALAALMENAGKDAPPNRYILVGASASALEGHPVYRNVAAGVDAFRERIAAFPRLIIHQHDVMVQVAAEAEEDRVNGLRLAHDYLAGLAELACETFGGRLSNDREAFGYVDGVVAKPMRANSRSKAPATAVDSSAGARELLGTKPDGGAWVLHQRFQQDVTAFSHLESDRKNDVFGIKPNGDKIPEPPPNAHVTLARKLKPAMTRRGFPYRRDGIEGLAFVAAAADPTVFGDTLAQMFSHKDRLLPFVRAIEDTGLYFAPAAATPLSVAKPAQRLPALAVTSDDPVVGRTAPLVLYSVAATIATYVDTIKENGFIDDLHVLGEAKIARRVQPLVELLHQVLSGGRIRALRLQWEARGQVGQPWTPGCHGDRFSARRASGSRHAGSECNQPAVGRVHHAGRLMSASFTAWLLALDPDKRRATSSPASWIGIFLSGTVVMAIAGLVPVSRDYFGLRFWPAFCMFVPPIVVGAVGGDLEAKGRLGLRAYGTTLFVNSVLFQLYMGSLVAFSRAPGAALMGAFPVLLACYHGHLLHSSPRHPYGTVATTLALAGNLALNHDREHLVLMALIAPASILGSLVLGQFSVASRRERDERIALRQAVDAQILSDRTREVERVAGSVLRLRAHSHDAGNTLSSTLINAQLLVAALEKHQLEDGDRAEALALTRDSLGRVEGDEGAPRDRPRGRNRGTTVVRDRRPRARSASRGRTDQCPLHPVDVLDSLRGRALGLSCVGVGRRDVPRSHARQSRAQRRSRERGGDGESRRRRRLVRQGSRTGVYPRGRRRPGVQPSSAGRAAIRVHDDEGRWNGARSIHDRPIGARQPWLHRAGQPWHRGSDRRARFEPRKNGGGRGCRASLRPARSERRTPCRVAGVRAVMKPEEQIAARALELAGHSRLGAEVTRDLAASFRGADPQFCRFLWTAGLDAGLDPDELLARCSTIFFQYVAVQVSDDLSDGDCTYLTEPGKVGPVVLLLLQHLFYHGALMSRIPRDTLAGVARRFLRVGAAQRIELRTREWGLANARNAAAGLNAAQFSAYLELLWWGTPLAARAESVGKHLGIAVHVASDARSRDRRFTSLSTRDRKTLLRWAAASAKVLRAEHLQSLDRVLPTVLSSLNDGA